MYRIKTLNKISTVGLGQLSKDQFQVGTDVENEDGILVRSAPMQDYVFPNALRAIARAGAGTNNIPIDRCSENGIVVFNTPGANANAVKELVIAAMLIGFTHLVALYAAMAQIGTEGNLGYLVPRVALSLASTAVWSVFCALSFLAPWAASARTRDALAIAGLAAAVLLIAVSAG